MIRTIQSIKEFGIFYDFHWPADLPGFKQLNLIYGWNYSGKTTLSRAFRCFEKNLPHADFATARVQLKSDDGTVYNLPNPQPVPIFRVFNSDFVRDNLSFTTGSAIPILVLGEENLVNKETLKRKKEERATLSQSKESNAREMENRKSSIDKALTNYARDLIKNPLAVPNYDKTKFEPNVIECLNDPENYLLDNEILTQCLSIYRSTEKKPALLPKVLSISSIEEITRETAGLLARIVTANIPIPRLRDNPLVETWVNEGRPLHIKESICQFCGQQLPMDLLSKLADHFSDDYEKLMAELKGLIEKTRFAQKEEITLDHRNDFYTELQERFESEKNGLDKLLKKRKIILGMLEKAVVEKQMKAFTKLNCPAIDDPTEEIQTVIETINKIIANHNNRTAEFERKRQETFAKLEKHYAASFIRDQEYIDQIHKIDDLKNTIIEQEIMLGKLENEIRALEQVVSESAKGAERINDLLSAYFGKDDLRIVISVDEQFSIIRGGIVAKNLSEGEKTAIAFAYFITRVQDGRHPIQNTRIVIDDPVSSLDANHIFNTYSLIKTQLVGCRQLFILTHSFEFYSLIRDWMADDEGKDHARKPQADWKKWGVFLVKRTDDGKAVLEEIPKELLKFKSEYHYLFSTIYHFYKSGSGNFDCLLSLPNIIRRFMEAFGGIMIPLSMGLKGKMELIFHDEIVRERVWKFINYYSHQTSIIRSLTIPDISECKSVVHECLKAVQNWNSRYFTDLESEIN